MTTRQRLFNWFHWRRHWQYVLLLPWLVPLLCYAVVGPAYGQRLSVLLGASLLVGALVSGWFWALDRATAAVVRRFPGLRQTMQRVLLTTLACCLISAVLLAVTVSLVAYFQLFDTHLTLTRFFSASGVLPQARAWLSRQVGVPLSQGAVTAIVYGLDVAVVLLLVVAYESFYLLGQWKASKISYEQRRKAALQGQLQSLKNQINPHFLFNTLNSLSSLIADEPRRAEAFVDEMAKVYRYLLQTNEQELTSLAVELSFIESYFHLLKTRHGAGLHLHVAVEQAYLAHCLPPLTLQMLVENAVKHNVIKATRPLHITLETTGGALRVRNNSQPKTTRVESTHVGLANITARYQLLAHASPLVEDSPEQFAVTVPLLSPAATETAGMPVQAA